MISNQANQSALWMVTQEPVLNEFVCYLSEKKDQILTHPERSHHLRFSKRQLNGVNQAFANAIRKGEAQLHRLCGLLASRLLEDQFELKSRVIGRLTSTDERFELNRGLQWQELFARTDLDLGNWQLSRLRFQSEGGGWERPALVANFVEYQPVQANAYQVFKMISRIKAEEEIWAKTVDEIFRVDQLVERDKQLRKLSFFIKDVFGIKLVVNQKEDVERLYHRLQQMRWSSEELARHRLPYLSATESLQIIEVKHHLGASGQKQSGWQAIKLVCRWWDKTFEIQIQALDIYFREQEYLTTESHAGFKERREKIRQDLAAKIPLFGFYMDLLRWLFVTPEKEPPQMSNIQIEIDASG
jgi:hypothetical protein